MGKQTKRITTIRLDEIDRERIAKIKAEFNYPDDATAIRAAIMMLANDIPNAKTKKKLVRKILDEA